MILYLSGPMHNLPSNNFPAFEQAAVALRAKGYDVLSPHENVEEQGLAWADYLRADLIAMLQQCNTIVMLPGWEASRGANLERYVAEALGFTVYLVGELM